MKTFKSIPSILILLGVLFIQNLSLAQKTDILIMNNGDHITGEIKNLKHGLLTYKTDDAGTLTIKWDKIFKLWSVYQFEIETKDGILYLGTLLEPDTLKTLKLGVQEYTEIIETHQIIRITPIKRRFWNRLDGGLTLGFDFKKSSNLSTLSYAFYNTYTKSKLKTNLDYSGNFTAQKNMEESSRHDLTLGLIRTMKKRWFYGISTGLQRNSELGLDLRIYIGGGFGRHIVQSNRVAFDFTTGAQATEEWLNDESTETTNLEGLLQINFSFFKHDSPKSDISFNANILPGLTSWGRLRSDIKLQLNQEIVSDFIVGLSFYNSFDNQSAEGAGSNDWGINTSLGYTW